MKKILFTLFKIYSGHLFGQTYTITPQQIVVLPAIVNESSGIEVNPADTSKIWTHNDSGDSAYVYQVTTQGQLLRKIIIGTGKAVDIEDITRDDAGNYYIADVGNNNNNRTNLIIHKVANLDTVTTKAVNNDKIFFSYPDQTLFPPPAAMQNFDCEALFHYNKHLYLFSKNKGNSTFVRMYSVPDSAGTYVATLVDSVDIGTNIGSWITAADMSPDHSKIALLSDNSLHVFSNYTGVNFFGGIHTHYNFPNYSQKEALVFLNNDELYITDEYNPMLNNGGNLYKLNLASVLTANQWLSTTVVKLYPNPSNDLLYIDINHTLTKPLSVSIYNTLGALVISKRYTTTELNYITLNVTELTAGAYKLQLTYENISRVIGFVRK
ncbi:MAG: T9SS type A sorting domain-containing protein [Bacteroidia bacterium]|nr:T9SS type A sorting domain-containing protein [Bacteroidia bacterium]